MTRRCEFSVYPVWALGRRVKGLIWENFFLFGVGFDWPWYDGLYDAHAVLDGDSMKSTIFTAVGGSSY